MLTIIHGDDIAASRNYFLDLKNKYTEKIDIEGEKITLTDLTQIFESNSLFLEIKNIFIEQLLSKKKKVAGFDQIIMLIKNNKQEHNIIMWENKLLDKSVLNEFNQDTIKVFKLPQTLFIFLDSLKPGNGKTLISLFHQTLETTEPEMIFFMLIRQIRLLLALSQESENSIDEIKKMHSWQKGKLENQAKLFKEDELKNLYAALFDIESKQKTGMLALPLASAIDFFLLEL